MQPSHAIFATLLVPGSAHFVLGKPGRAAVAFVATVGLFWIGYAIVGTQLWYHLLFAGGGWFEPVLRFVPLQLLPESPNLGCTMVASFLRDTVSPEAQRIERMPVEWGHVGLLLTSCSGVLNCIWMADAHWLAQERQPKGPVAPALAAGVSWLLPGAGHAMAGQKSKGMLLGAAVLIMFFAGLAFSGGHAVDCELQSAWFDGEVLCGAGVIFASFVTAPLRYETLPSHLDLGTMMCTVAGFMNLLVMANAYTVAEDGPESFVAPEAAK